MPPLSRSTPKMSRSTMMPYNCTFIIIHSIRYRWPAPFGPFLCMISGTWTSVRRDSPNIHRKIHCDYPVNPNYARDNGKFSPLLGRCSATKTRKHPAVQRVPGWVCCGASPTKHRPQRKTGPSDSAAWPEEGSLGPSDHGEVNISGPAFFALAGSGRSLFTGVPFTSYSVAPSSCCVRAWNSKSSAPLSFKSRVAK